MSSKTKVFECNADNGIDTPLRKVIHISVSGKNCLNFFRYSTETNRSRF